jgi:hypothetical protein
MCLNKSIHLCTAAYPAAIEVQSGMRKFWDYSTPEPQYQGQPYSTIYPQCEFLGSSNHVGGETLSVL